jgi:hypothetical protein
MYTGFVNFALCSGNVPSCSTLLAHIDDIEHGVETELAT